MLGSGEWDEYGSGTRLTPDQDSHVTWGVLQEPEEPAVLEEVGGRVDENELGVLVASHARKIGSWGEGRESRSPCHEPCLYETLPVLSKGGGSAGEIRWIRDR